MEAIEIRSSKNIENNEDLLVMDELLPLLDSKLFNSRQKNV